MLIGETAMKFNARWMGVRREYDRHVVLDEAGQVISAVYRKRLPRPDRPTVQVPDAGGLDSVALVLSAGLGLCLTGLVALVGVLA